jgi:DNA helicase HerA-like ATPase
MLELSEAQEGVLNIAFRVADEQGLALLDLKDLQALLVWVGQNGRELGLRYGHVSSQSVGAIQRRLLVLENQGAAHLFGELALGLSDLMAVDVTPNGPRGRVNILASDKLMNAPKLYATFLLWLLSELFEELPEMGNPDKPKLVFFFDEAHLLFDDAPKVLVDKVEQVAVLSGPKALLCTSSRKTPPMCQKTFWVSLVTVCSMLCARLRHGIKRPLDWPPRHTAKILRLILNKLLLKSVSAKR